MAEPVQERPNLPKPVLYALAEWALQLTRALADLFQAYGYRLNRVLTKDGLERMDAPLPLQSVEVADLPDATEWEGSLIYVSDGAPGSKVRYSDGTNWVDLG